MESTISPEFIKLLITAFILIVIVVFIVKKAVKLAFAIIAILFIFKVGFMFSGTDMDEKFGLSNYFKGDSGNAVVGFFDDFNDRRNSSGIVDEEKVYDGLVSGIEGTVNFTKEQVKEFDYLGFVNSFVDVLYDAGAEHIDKAQLERILGEQMENISEEDLKKLSDIIIEKLKGMDSNTESGS